MEDWGICYLCKIWKKIIILLTANCLSYPGKKLVNSAFQGSLFKM